MVCIHRYSCVTLFHHRWSSSQVWPSGSFVRHGKDLYKAEGQRNCAEPGNAGQSRFYVSTWIFWQQFRGIKLFNNVCMYIKGRWFHEIFARISGISEWPDSHCTIWKNEKFSLAKKIFRQINYLLTYFVKPLLSRNFCQKCVRKFP